MRTSASVVTVPITGAPSAFNANSTELTLPTGIPRVNVTDAPADIVPTGAVTVGAVARGVGAAVSGAPAVSGTPTYNSLSVNAVTNPSGNGQTVQYAISTSNGLTGAALDGLIWQTLTAFGDLAEDTVYYVYARTAANTNYNTGPALQSSGIRTAVQPPDNLTGISTISNTTPRVGDTLTGSLIGGNNTGILTYTWRAGTLTLGTGTTYTVTAADLGRIITLEITSSVQTGTVISAAASPVAKRAAPSVPSAPTLASMTHNSVTLAGNPAHEFSIDGSAWQASNVFSNLTPSTEYTITQRIAETDDTEASSASAALIVTTNSAPPDALTGTAVISVTSPRIGDTLTGSLTGSNNTGILTFTWRAGGLTLGTGTTYSVTAADLGRIITLEITSSVETGTITGSVASAVAKRASLLIPTAPTLAASTHNSITLAANAGHEFSIDGSAWQTSPVFTGLSPSTAYTFTQRIAETADTESSPASAGLTVTTEAPPQNALNGTASISNTSPRIGDTLTGSLIGGNNTGTLSYTWKSGALTLGTGTAYTVTIADLGRTITLEITSSAEAGTRTSVATAAAAKKAGPAAPEAPTFVSRTQNSVTLTEIEGCEFSIDGTAWQTSNVFSGLTPNTAYNFYQRAAETDDTENSVASIALSVTTLAPAQNNPPPPPYIPPPPVPEPVPPPVDETDDPTDPEESTEHEEPEAPQTPPSNPFSDVSEEDWFYNYVIFVQSNGLMQGTNLETMEFSPNTTLTRAMLITILYRMEGSPQVTSGQTAIFEDAAEGDWFFEAVQWAAENGIVRGYGNGMFGSDDNISRQDLAVILMRYAAIAGYTLPALRDSENFNDDDAISDYAKEAVESLFRAEIVNGKGGGMFDPLGQATRAEVAAMLYRFLQNASLR